MKNDKKKNLFRLNMSSDKSLRRDKYRNVSRHGASAIRHGRLSAADEALSASAGAGQNVRREGGPTPGTISQ
ncbi:MAG: hypothetical protein ABII20_04235 [Candidatus Omnitrophota bacterium]|nr:hypothetical protein [Candidatus Omnitrophota bacterium]MBU3929339.1 hypothetical protein [bacterium]MBU4122454.1 hypothetical protein [bacterium]